MQGKPYRTTTWRNAALGIAVCAGLILSGCGGAGDVQLPADRTESAGLCYGATLALVQEKVGKGSVPLDDASHALHFALLAGTDGDLDDPAKVVARIESIGTQDKGLQDKFVADKKAASYTAPCAKAFPETQAGAFKGLPPDTRDTRTQCYVLSTVLLQIFAQSEIAPDPRAATWVKLNGQLEQLSNNEVYPAEDDNHIGEIAMRALAQAVRWGPPVDAMAACGERYLKD
ncbi:MAG TPA: hypothetical protein VHO04_13380 [Sphingopyxis sp.]|uniref:hypothetical protein n=1 Tax=Sphingopyxis sp. TaxID=1908224 RepID=UPI002E350645|nr:hypothetical protein [Sphingopyxis sp.]HEX2813662.1 hypothetical protein [Sphingopyxis sp.]